jgi:hypothetical protein
MTSMTGWATLQRQVLLTVGCEIAGPPVNVRERPPSNREECALGRRLGSAARSSC